MVLRDGKQMNIPSEDLVPGDIVLLNEGDQVPADMRLIEAAGLKITEVCVCAVCVPCRVECGVWRAVPCRVECGVWRVWHVRCNVSVNRTIA